MQDKGTVTRMPRCPVQSCARACLLDTIGRLIDTRRAVSRLERDCHGPGPARFREATSQPAGAIGDLHAVRAPQPIGASWPAKAPWCSLRSVHPATERNEARTTL
jgi:hypothetical protein